MSRLMDVLVSPFGGERPPLPVVDWQRIGQRKPSLPPVAYGGPSEPLPKGDVLLLTWTSAEWSALDQVFINSSSTRTQQSRDWQRSWHLYARQAPTQLSDPAAAPLWGYFQVADVTSGTGGTARVVLLKCDTHLAHPPWFAGLQEMIQLALADVQPRIVYSIGTAGGSRDTLRLGDVVITNSAHIELHNPANAGAPINAKTVTCSGAFPSQSLAGDVSAQLFYELSNVVSFPNLEFMLQQLRQQVPAAANLQLADLVNAPLNPASLRQLGVVPAAGEPLLTTDYYYIATGGDASQWSALEMDDAVIGYVAGESGVDFAFVRNISDPLVPTATQAGAAIPDEARDQWSSLIYQQYGLYTSYNGALATWAAIAGSL